MANSPSGESLISRAVRVLEALADRTNAGKSVRETAKAAGLPVSTTYRILSELEVEGLVTRDSEGSGWQHGTRLWEIALSGAPVESLRSAAVSAMEDLVASLEVHVSLGILDRNEVLYIERFAPHGFTENITSVAGRLPVHATSAGLTLMAYASPAEQELLLSRNLKKFTDATSTDPGELRRILATIRRDGYCATPGAVIAESTGISVPIFQLRPVRHPPNAVKETPTRSKITPVSLEYQLMSVETKDEDSRAEVLADSTTPAKVTLI